MTYTVKEIFKTLQGEGGQMGRVAVFCRFSGCNLWSGREEDRAESACNFCDTDFVGGEKYRTAKLLVDSIVATWNGPIQNRLVVLTGGEPLLQVDRTLLEDLRMRNFSIALETNGSIAAPNGIDWICVSPKTRATLRQNTGDELKFVFPQLDLRPEEFEKFPFGRFSLSPMAGPNLRKNTQAAIDYCLAHPQWRLTMQAHKVWNLR